MYPAKIREYFDRYTYNVGLRGTQRIDQAYGTFSSKKAASWNKICGDCIDLHGHYLTVITHNGWYYSAGFLYKIDEAYYFRVYTASDRGEMRLSNNDIIELIRQGMYFE